MHSCRPGRGPRAVLCVVFLCCVSCGWEPCPGEHSRLGAASLHVGADGQRHVLALHDVYSTNGEYATADGALYASQKAPDGWRKQRVLIGDGQSRVGHLQSLRLVLCDDDQGFVYAVLNRGRPTNTVFEPETPNEAWAYEPGAGWLAVSPGTLGADALRTLQYGQVGAAWTDAAGATRVLVGDHVFRLSGGKIDGASPLSCGADPCPEPYARVTRADGKPELVFIREAPATKERSYEAAPLVCDGAGCRLEQAEALFTTPVPGNARDSERYLRLGSGQLVAVTSTSSKTSIETAKGTLTAADGDYRYAAVPLPVNAAGPADDGLLVFLWRDDGAVQLFRGSPTGPGELLELGQREPEHHQTACGPDAAALADRGGHLELDVACGDGEHIVIFSVRLDTLELSVASVRYQGNQPLGEIG